MRKPVRLYPRGCQTFMNFLNFFLSPAFHWYVLEKNYVKMSRTGQDKRNHLNPSLVTQYSPKRLQSAPAIWLGMSYREHLSSGLHTIGEQGMNEVRCFRYFNILRCVSISMTFRCWTFHFEDLTPLVHWERQGCGGQNAAERKQDILHCVLRPGTEHSNLLKIRTHFICDFRRNEGQSTGREEAHGGQKLLGGPGVWQQQWGRQSLHIRGLKIY